MQRLKAASVVPQAQDKHWLEKSRLSSLPSTRILFTAPPYTTAAAQFSASEVNEIRRRSGFTSPPSFRPLKPRCCFFLHHAAKTNATSTRSCQEETAAAARPAVRGVNPNVQRGGLQCFNAAALRHARCFRRARSSSSSSRSQFVCMLRSCSANFKALCAAGIWNPEDSNRRLNKLLSAARGCRFHSEKK